METNEIISSITDKVKDTANVNVVFGDPIETGGVTIIPVASVRVAGGGGGGRGTQGRRGENEEAAPSGRGMGIGVRVMATPLGYIEVKDGEARFVQVVDATRIAVSAMLAGSFILIAANRMMRFRAWKRGARMAKMAHMARHMSA